MRTIKSNSILLLILTIFTAFVAPVTQVVQAHNNNGEYVKFDETEYIEFIEYGEVISVEDYTTQSTKRISITFKDLIIGWLIDGTIEYVPNFSYFKDGILTETLQISSDITINQISDFLTSK